MGKQSASLSGLYNDRWRRLRHAYLSANPLCVMCKQDGAITAATEVDHIVKHDGNRRLFYASDNLQGLCAAHHRGYKARLERSGKDTATDVDGNPINAGGHW